MQKRLVDARQPFCMLIGPDSRYLASWGSAAAYGLEDLHPGDDIRGRAPFLEAYPGGDAELPFITDSQGHAFHAHVIRERDGFYVLLIDARAELEERRRAQQKANEVQLLLDRERRIIAELVDARAELSLRRKEAEAESRRRGEYIATMSHEFRTPLMALLAHAERLDRAGLPRDAKEAADAVRRITQQQIWLVDNLLTGARIEAEGFAIHPQATDLRRLVRDLCLVFAPLAADSGLSFAAYLDSVPEFVLVDDLHLRQVLVNLLGNAVKFTDEGGVDLEIGYCDGRLRLTIGDTGPGIARDDQAVLFDAFQRGGAAPRKSGAGLGLAITRALVEAMGGTLRLDSELGCGTRVELDIAAAVVQPSPDQCAGDGTSILIGEDDPDVADLLALKLGEAGYRVKVVDNGRSVVEIGTAEKPDLIILDTNMPQLDGPAAARCLRERGFAAPILALSAANRSHDIEFALASGCTEFLRKPAHPETVKRIVRELVLKSEGRSAGTAHP